MRQPTRFARQIGTRGFCALAGSAAALVTGVWLTNEMAVSWPVPLALIALAVHAFKTKREVDAFNLWQQDWNRLAGIAEPAEPNKTSQTIRRRPLLGVWLLLFVLAIAQPFGALVNQAATVASMLMTMFCVGTFVWQKMRFLDAPSTGKSTGKAASNLHIVQTPLPVPRRAPSVAQATAALPDYCLALLGRQDDTRQH